MGIKESPKIIVLPSFYPMRFLYTGSFFEEQVRLIRKSGIDASVVYNEDRSITSFTFKKFGNIHFQKQFKIEGEIPVLRRMNWNVIPVKFKLGRKIWVNDAIKLVELYIKRYNVPSLIHAHCALNAGSVAKYIKGKWHIPYVITEHLSIYDDVYGTSPAKIRETLSVYQNAEKVITVSKYLRDVVSEKTGFSAEKIEIIPNFIDTDYFNPNETTSLAESVKEKIVLTVCHVVSIKRLDRLLDAFKIVSEKYPDWKLIIGGDGPQINVIKNYAAKLGFQDNVVFTGFLTKEQVKSHMKRASIVVSSSDIETFGVLLIEAMAMGLPVIATSSGGPADIITKDTGLLVEKNTVSLANGIMDIILNYDRYDKKSIREYAINNFSGEAIAGKYINLYHKINRK